MIQRVTEHISQILNGRPPSVDLTNRLHAAVWRLLETDGYTSLTMDGIAREAGVSRPALYRRYSGIGQAVLGALLQQGSSRLTMPYSDNLSADLRQYLNVVVRSLRRGETLGKALCGVLSQALIDDRFAPEFERFIVSRREPVRKRLLADDSRWTEANIDSTLDRLFGPVLYRLLIRGTGVSPELIANTVRNALLCNAQAREELDLLDL